MDILLADTLLEKAIGPKFNYWIYIVLMMIGMWAMISKNNLIKKLIGMSIFQTAIILFWVSIGVKGEEATIPILDHDTVHDYHHAQEDGKKPAPPKIDATKYTNPLPHVLMLTAIVVGVSTLGVALSIAQRVYQEYGSLEEDEIIEKVKAHGGHHG